MMPFSKNAAAKFLVVVAVACGAGSSASMAQENLPNELVCFRYLQTYERSLRIPQGLLTAVSLVETGRPSTGGELTPWPWVINVNGKGTFFESKEEAVAQTRKIIDEGQRSVDVGCMQVNLRYHPNAFKSLEEAFDPATNVAYGAQFLKSLHDVQGSWNKAVERYHSSDNGRREEYREKVIALWNSDVRSLVMNAVLAEDTDTPYHRAVRDFAAGRFVDAIDKYRAIVDLNPKDRIGLLGLAMSYERLGRTVEADQSYLRYLSVEPENVRVLSSVVDKARRLPPEQALAALTNVVNAGVNSPELLAATAEVAASAGNYETAFKYASDAAQAAPDVTMYYLNAGIFADRLNRSADAVKFYEQFLVSFEQHPAVFDTPIDGIRSRLQFLRKRL
jgi:Flp pilus assembly protein TadD